MKGGEVNVMLHKDWMTYVQQGVNTIYSVRNNESNNQVNVSLLIEEWNEYAVRFEENSVTFYVNGIETLKYKKNDGDVVGQFPFWNYKYFIMFNSMLDPNQFRWIQQKYLPAKLCIDWIKVYSFVDI